MLGTDGETDFDGLPGGCYVLALSSALVSAPSGELPLTPCNPWWGFASRSFRPRWRGLLEMVLAWYR